MRRFAVSLFSILLLAGAGCAPRSDVAVPPVPPPVAAKPVVPSTPNKTWTFSGKLPDEQIKNKQVRLSTPKGDIVFELFAGTAPLAVSNFVSLAVGGYFDGLTFHRREEGFVIQGGDPKGNGTGGPGYTFEDELDDGWTYARGIVAMANRGPDTNGSQFFIMLADTPLPKNYTIFGRVVSGMDAVDQIKVGDVMTTVTVEEKGR